MEDQAVPPARHPDQDRPEVVVDRISGQGDWGYDVFRTCPLERVAGVDQERGDILDLPRFSDDESLLIGGAGPGFLGPWWAHPDDEAEAPARSGPVSLGYLFVHRFPAHRVSLHELRVRVPRGWAAADPWAEWLGPRDITPTTGGVRLTAWGVSVEVRNPLPRVIWLPAPRPTGRGLL